MINIERDNPEVVDRARRRISEMAGTLQKHAGNEMLQYGAKTRISGYLGALLIHGLLSMKVWNELRDELNAQYAASTGALVGLKGLNLEFALPSSSDSKNS